MKYGTATEVAPAVSPAAWAALPLQASTYRVLVYLVLNALLAVLSCALLLVFGVVSALLCSDAPVIQTTHWMVLLEVELYNRLVDRTIAEDRGSLLRQSTSKRIFVHFELGSGTATSSMEGYRMTHGVSTRMLVYFGGGKLVVAGAALVLPALLLATGGYCLASVAACPALLLAPLLLRVGAGVVLVYLGCFALHALADWTLALTRGLCSEPFASYEYLHGILV
ncbi:hypothetical protein ACHHYP_04470 [Achlya hypogyna]|uniref:Transmembrane protein n=1 Tax=Achlya hypogyna TaxID=1202772 RepID=A0A1V9Z0V8_ACHHY|nr:hypothetical protein ACHHYP_04470 [Achlya hypogyna]